jgi:methionine-rich copper-binding protein CopC
MLLRRLICGTAAAAVLLGGAATAFAHATLLRTSPAKAAVVRHLPTKVTLTFNEPPLRIVSVKVMNGTANHTVSAKFNPKNARQIVVTTKSDTLGRYRVIYTLIADDGDRQVGTYAFRVSR